MSEQISEQISAFLDGELPDSETELLLKRMARDERLRQRFGRYALIGEALRSGSSGSLTAGFAARVNGAIDGEPAMPLAPVARVRAPRWWRPLAGAAVAAGVAAVAVVALQQRADAPGNAAVVAAASSGAPRTAWVAANVAAPGSPATSHPREALSYTVPAAAPEPLTSLPAARLTRYVFAHSRYSSVLGQSTVLSGLLTADEQEGADAQPADLGAGEPHAAGAPGAAAGSGAAGAATAGQGRDAHIAP